MSKVAVLGASVNPDRFSNRAVRMLVKYGHQVFPIHPAHDSIEGIQCYKKLSDITEFIDTLTIYVGPQQIEPLIAEIISAHPKRVILNPGTESEKLISALHENKIVYQKACTLVLLETKQF